MFEWCVRWMEIRVKKWMGGSVRMDAWRWIELVVKKWMGGSVRMDAWRWMEVMVRTQGFLFLTLSLLYNFSFNPKELSRISSLSVNSLKYFYDHRRAAK